jgi:hypothetical protein
MATVVVVRGYANHPEKSTCWQSVKLMVTPLQLSAAKIIANKRAQTRASIQTDVSHLAPQNPASPVGQEKYSIQVCGHNTDRLVGRKSKYMQAAFTRRGSCMKPSKTFFLRKSRRKAPQNPLLQIVRIMLRTCLGKATGYRFNHNGKTTY